MIRITDLILPFDHSESDLESAIRRVLEIKPEELKSIKIIKSSLDARKKHKIRRVFTVQVETTGEKEILDRHAKNQQVKKAEVAVYASPVLIRKTGTHRPLIIGTGPAGLFAGLILAEAGLGPLILERGKPVKERTQDTFQFWKNRNLNTESNVQFGEGGAGTFSDGKLQTRVKDKVNRDKKVLNELVIAGAPEEILYENKPHLGTANLVNIVQSLREKIIRLGGEYKFLSRVDDLILEGELIKGVLLDSGEEIHSDTVFLATGHSARDTFEMLDRRGVKLEAKPFSIGFRIEHPQILIDQNQYRQYAGHPRLRAADYQLAHHSSSGRTVYSFCMCPGGTVIAASSEPGMVVTNGMSQYARNEINANSAIVAEVYPADFGNEPLGGIALQRYWERIAYQIGGGNYDAPCQLVGNFLSGKPSTALGTVTPSYQPGIKLTDLRECLPGYVMGAILEALPEFEKRIQGFICDDAVLTGVETRTSSPVRIIRGKDYQSISVRGLYPIGEGSGYAGGILSSAMDGIKAAEAFIDRVQGE
ncbi:MAG: hypothetical protein WBB69_01195 [Anaerolineales bacterium]